MIRTLRPGGLAAVGIDPIILYAFLLSLTLGTPIALGVFNSPAGYLLEACIVIVGVGALMIRDQFQPRLLWGAIAGTLGAAFVLAGFMLLGVSNGASLAEAYRDYRELVLFVFVLLFFNTLNPAAALRIFRLTALFVLAQWAIVISLHLTFLPGVNLENGKVGLPVAVFGIASLLLAVEKSPMSFVVLAVIWFCAAFTAYRYIYIQAIMFTVSVILIFIWSNSKVTLRFATAFAVLWVAIWAWGPDSRLAAVRLVDQAQAFSTSRGASYQISDQIFKKTRALLTGTAMRGDLTYQYYNRNILNFGLFAIPHGLGHDHFVADAALDNEGNTVDNGFIFLDFHFSIWGLLLFVAAAAAWMFSRIRYIAIGNWPIIAAFLVPLIFVFYSRAVLILSPFSSASFGAAIIVTDIVMRVFREVPEGTAATRPA